MDRFSSLDELESVRARWMELYEIDSAANVFLSWEWVKACLSTERKHWAVFGVRDSNGPYLAFLLVTFDRFPPVGPVLSRELSLGGAPRADFTGMLGVTGEDSRLIPALAREIEALPWDNFSISSCDDRRIEALVSEFLPSRYTVERDEDTPCPYIDLPTTWDEYLSSRSRSTRRTIRYHLHKLESLPGYRLEFPTAAEAEPVIEALLQINSARWKKSLRECRKLFGGLFSRCYEAGCFQMVAMYEYEALIAAQGFFHDDKRRTAVAYMIGHNPAYAQYSPGAMMGCASIRRAIEEGYSRYELSRGDQPYKKSLATGIKYTTNATLWRRGIRVAALNAGRRGYFATKRLARNLLLRRAQSGSDDVRPS